MSAILIACHRPTRINNANQLIFGIVAVFSLVPCGVNQVLEPIRAVIDHLGAIIQRVDNGRSAFPAPTHR
jgi:hypothetical protein